MVGVSGGRDSVALLDALVAGGARELIVVHVDHRLRAESGEDARFVQEFARRLGVECIVRRANVRRRAKARGLSLEAAAREARYEHFAQVAKQRGCRRVLLAHHADDQVETFLFNLFRGAGPAGLAAMRAASTRVVHGVALEIVRPLLGVWREEIDAYIAARGLAFREDLSNADPRHTRNRVRHELVPRLQKIFGRDVRGAVWRATEILRAEEDLLAAAPELSAAAGDELCVATLRTLPLALQRRLLHAWLRGHGVPQVGFDAIETVRRLIEQPRPAKANLPGGWHARRRAGKLFLASGAARGSGI